MKFWEWKQKIKIQLIIEQEYKTIRKQWAVYFMLANVSMHKGHFFYFPPKMLKTILHDDGSILFLLTGLSEGEKN